MKKTVFLFLVLFLIFPLSCKQQASLLEYQQSEFQYHAKLVIKDCERAYTVVITRDNDNLMSLEFESPEELSLISFQKNDSGVCALCNGEPWEGMTFPYAEGIFELFCIESESFLSAESSKQGEVPICRAYFEGGVTVTLDQRNNSPLVIENESLKLTIIK